MGFEALTFSGQTKVGRNSSTQLSQGDTWGPPPVALQLPRAVGDLPGPQAPNSTVTLQGSSGEGLPLTTGCGWHMLGSTSQLSIFSHVFWQKAVDMDVHRHRFAR